MAAIWTLHAGSRFRPSRDGSLSAARTVSWLTALGMVVAVGMVALGIVVLLDARRDAWKQSERAADNLAIALERDIARNIQVYDLSLQGTIEALRLPGINEISPDLRQAAIFDRAANAEYLGSLLVLDAVGTVVADSTAVQPHPLNFADRDYFQVHQEQADAGLYVSRPFRSRLRGGDPSVAISRRRPDVDGRFAGVVVGTMRLAYFQSLFERLNLGTGGAVLLLRTDGQVIARRPLRDADIGRDLSATDGFRQYSAASSGHFIGTSRLDGIQRAYTFRHIGNLPLVLSVAMSVDDLYAAWWHKAWGIGLILAVLCVATVALCTLFRRELLLRLAAEAELVEAAGRLSVVAATDGLTGLANRRAFDAALTGAWQTAAENGTPLALLMIDADRFKSYNDHYGHPAGDMVLQRIADCIQVNTRGPGDFGVRYGGEEFAALLPGAGLQSAVGIAERLRSSIAELSIPHDAGPNGQVTVSIGVAVAHPRRGTGGELLVQQADNALYEAKRAGRDRVCSADHLLVPAPDGLAATGCDGSGV